MAWQATDSILVARGQCTWWWWWSHVVGADSASGVETSTLFSFFRHTALTERRILYSMYEYVSKERSRILYVLDEYVSMSKERSKVQLSITKFTKWGLQCKYVRR